MAKRRESWSRTLKLLLASSRPLQATISISQPLFAAFLALGGIPRADTLILLIIGSIAGMFCVFAINDAMDAGVDRQMAKAGKRKDWDMDSVFARHPLGLGLVSEKQQLAWISGTGLVAIVILYALSPLALMFFALAVLLEVFYCKLAKVTGLKVLVSGLVVALAGIIGWLAVGTEQGQMVLIPILLLFFTWEIGGRNIANDLSDVKEDRRLGIRTIPSVCGTRRAAILIAGFATLAMLASFEVGLYAGLGTGYLIVTTLAGMALLACPALELLQQQTPQNALDYFNKASLYPLALFITLGLTYLLK